MCECVCVVPVCVCARLQATVCNQKSEGDGEFIVSMREREWLFPCVCACVYSRVKCVRGLCANLCVRGIAV